MFRVLLALLLGFTTCFGAGLEPLSGDLFVHDPSPILNEGSKYCLFSTGPGISSKISTNRLHWVRSQPVFSSVPEWTTNAITGFRGYFWAPDIIRLKDRYYLYYSVSTFGKQRSAIGLATKSALNQTPEDWKDQGPVLESKPGDPFNAIDPSVLLDKDSKLWMAFGSFWKGIYLVELDPSTGKRISPNSSFHQLAYNEAIEAATLHRHGDDYYLFVNWGACCRGTNSTYEVRVGRSKRITGPYLDREGKNLIERGGSLFLKTEGSNIGPGHVGFLSDNDQEFMSYHVYDATKGGRSELRIRTITWSPDGWPIAAD